MLRSILRAVVLLLLIVYTLDTISTLEYSHSVNQLVPTPILPTPIPNVYACNTCNYLTQWGSQGSGNGQFNGPVGVTIDSLGKVYVTDTGNNRVEKLTSTGIYVTQWGSFGSGNGQFSLPSGVAVDFSGNVYVVDRGNNRVEEFTSTDGITYTYHSQLGSYGSGDGQFDNPLFIVVDSLGNVYVVDGGNNRVEEFSSTGVFDGYGGGCTSGSNCVSGTSVGFSCTSATCGLAVSGSGNGQFNGPQGIAIDSLGNIYVVDSGNNRVEKFTSTGTYITQWGSYGSGDGQFILPVGAAVDSSLNVYVTDGHSSNRVEEFSSTGVFDGYGGGCTTQSANCVTNSAGGFNSVGFTCNAAICGMPVSGSGNGQFNPPLGVAVDSLMNVYVVDNVNDRVEKFGDQVGMTVTVTMSNLAPSATVTINGCNPSPSTFSSDGTPHTITMNPSCSFTLSFSNSGTTTRDGFSGPSGFSATSATQTSCSAPTGCSAITLTAYLQLQDTYQATPNAQPTWDTGLTPISVTGTYLGTGGYTICLITLHGNGGAASCSGYADYSMAVLFPSTIDGAPANSRWAATTYPAQPTFTDTGGGNTHNVNYYKQLNNMYQVTAQAQPNFDASLTWTITGTYLGTPLSTICTINSTPNPGSTASCPSQSGWADYSTPVSFPVLATGAPTNTRWAPITYPQAPPPSTDTTGGNTHNVNYYKQYDLMLCYSISGGGSPQSVPMFTANQLGSPISPRPTLPLCSSPPPYTNWFDAGTWTVTPTLSSLNPNSEQWATSPTSGSVASLQPGTHDFIYYHQYYLTMEVAPFSNFGTVASSSSTQPSTQPCGQSPGSNWWNAGLSVTICAIPASGVNYPFAFTNWAGTGPDSYSGSANPATVTINGPITEIGYFTGPSVGFDFFLSKSGGITVNQGGSGSNIITVTAIHVTSQSVSLSCTSILPSGVVCSFNPASHVPPFQSTLTITTSSSTPVGSYAINVTGTRDVETEITMFTLRVNPVQSPELANHAYTGIAVHAIAIVGRTTYQVRLGQSPREASLSSYDIAAPLFTRPLSDVFRSVEVFVAVLFPGPRGLY